MTVETELSQAGRQTVRIPQNIMSLLRQSYDSREKVLDWCLAFGVAGALVYVFRDELAALARPPSVDPNAGRADEPIPNVDLATAFPANQRAQPSLYTYNMPVSRAIRYSVGPSGTMPPIDPSQPPDYSE